MAVFRVEKNKGYTVMSNHHLRNKELSLKAKGLLSQMLSLPEDWDYTLAGLSLINRESIDAIRTAVWELEKAGYITRRHESDIILHEAAVKALKAAGISKLPNLAELQGEYAKLQEQKEALYADYGKLKKQAKEYDIIKQNIDIILNIERQPERAKETERG